MSITHGLRELGILGERIHEEFNLRRTSMRPPICCQIVDKRGPRCRGALARQQLTNALRAAKRIIEKSTEAILRGPERHASRIAFLARYCALCRYICRRRRKEKHSFPVHGLLRQ